MSCGARKSEQLVGCRNQQRGLIFNSVVSMMDHRNLGLGGGGCENLYQLHSSVFSVELLRVFDTIASRPSAMCHWFKQIYATADMAFASMVLIKSEGSVCVCVCVCVSVCVCGGRCVYSGMWEERMTATLFAKIDLSLRHGDIIGDSITQHHTLSSFWSPAPYLPWLDECHHLRIACISHIWLIERGEEGETDGSGVRDVSSSALQASAGT